MWQSAVVRKKRFLWVAVGLIALATVWFAFLRRDEPKYEGRYLSEWLADYHSAMASMTSWTNGIGDARAQYAMAEAARGVNGIGTNAVPCLITWIQAEPWEWQDYLRPRLPSWLGKHKTVQDLLGAGATRRARDGWLGIHLLGSKAARSIPMLEVMMKKPDKTGHGNQAVILLGTLGEQAIPVLQRGLADPGQPDRRAIVWALRNIAAGGDTDACQPILVAALQDQDAAVRSAATNVIKQLAPQLLTNAPVK